MTLSVRLTADDENLLEKTAERLGRSKSEVARLAVREMCARYNREEPAPWVLGEDLFDTGDLADEPADPTKRAIQDKLREKHGLG